MRYHHRDPGYADGGYGCADCTSDCAACLFYRHPSRHGEPGDPFDFPCSETFRDHYEALRKEGEKLSPSHCTKKLEG